ncbi:MAG: TIM barrel protein [Burkholderiales bacterium]|nr:TIM barrel protein [Burkholderiales bacterium]
MNAWKIIAEIGINHGGSADIACQLIDAAARANAHAVKFQYRNLGNVYSSALEIGDQILEKEIRKSYLNPGEVLELAHLAKSRGMAAGISFFDIADMADFPHELASFDFFKLPSAELSNAPLVDAMLASGKQVYISTGCHSEPEVEAALSRLHRDNWTPLHCISNYPTTLQNARLGYLSYLKRRWKRPVGYSSHDANWEVCLLAMQLGAAVIERHITLDKNAQGLDHSSSSTPDEFAKLAEFAEDMALLMTGDGPRGPNQGELLNRQNLGRSFFAARDIGEGETITEDSLVYRSPRVGLDRSDITHYLGKQSRTSVARGSPISRSVFSKPKALSSGVLEHARKSGLSLPVRLHDLAFFEREFPIGAYEFHFSFDEVRALTDFPAVHPRQKYSVHLPDYVSSTLLMDPFSKDNSQREASLDILERTAQIAERLQERSGQSVPVVGSFSVVHRDLPEFFDSHAQLLGRYWKRGITVMPQWLPPIAWYFGGSVRLHAMNSETDIEHLQRLSMPVCMDICHLFMGSRLFGFDPAAVINKLEPNIRHLHIADATGVDGEGMQFGEGDPENLEVIRSTLAFPCLKVIEVWQGHLDNGAGFRRALQKLWELADGG